MLDIHIFVNSWHNTCKVYHKVVHQRVANLQPASEFRYSKISAMLHLRAERTSNATQ